jgi:hypothetical protein
LSIFNDRKKVYIVVSHYTRCRECGSGTDGYYVEKVFSHKEKAEEYANERYAMSVIREEIED